VGITSPEPAAGSEPTSRYRHVKGRGTLPHLLARWLPARRAPHVRAAGRSNRYAGGKCGRRPLTRRPPAAGKKRLAVGGLMGGAAGCITLAALRTPHTAYATKKRAASPWQPCVHLTPPTPSRPTPLRKYVLYYTPPSPSSPCRAPLRAPPYYIF
jgi:hypothetical protein